MVGENGQGALGPACLPFADEWCFRSAHPAFVERWAIFLGLILEGPIRFEQPQVWKTKGEVLSDLRHLGLSTDWERTSSCATRPKGRYGHHGCGICGGCLLRAVSVRAACLVAPEGCNAFDVYASDDVVSRNDHNGRPMTRTERAVAARSIGLMVEFAGFAGAPLKSDAAVVREARLINPGDSELAQAKLLRLVKQHRDEWEEFVSALPNRSWVREIVDRL